MHTTGLRAHAAVMSCGAGEQGMPFSWTQPTGSGGHGVPSGRTHPVSGMAWAGAAVIADVNDVASATAAAVQSSRKYLMNCGPSPLLNPTADVPSKTVKAAWQPRRA
jgi:hypothetical protein